jgi:hypothetical protein
MNLDDALECRRCGASCHDGLSLSRGWWKTECCFCGLLDITRAAQTQPRTEAVFVSGRFSGLTPDEAMGKPRGRDYVQLMSKEHPDAAVRAACEAALTAVVS